MSPRHVQFDSILASPPADRIRVSPLPNDLQARSHRGCQTTSQLGGLYPYVAQRKGTSDRRNSLDLYWGGRPISSTQSVDTKGQDSSLIVPSDNNVSPDSLTHPTMRLAHSCDQHGGKHEANSGRSAVKLPHVVREMLSTACETLTELTSPKLKQGSSLRHATHPLWSCPDRMSTASTPLETPTSSCCGSSTSSTSNSSSNSPTSETPGTSVFRE